MYLLIVFLLIFRLVSPTVLLYWYSKYIYTILTSSDFTVSESHLSILSIWCEINIKFCSVIAEILLQTGVQQNDNGKSRLRESLLNNDITKSHSCLTKTKYRFLIIFGRLHTQGWATNSQSASPRGLALKINAQRLFPSDKFMGVFFRLPYGSDGVNRVVYRLEFFGCYIEEGAF